MFQLLYCSIIEKKQKPLNVLFELRNEQSFPMVEKTSGLKNKHAKYYLQKKG